MKIKNPEELTEAEIEEIQVRVVRGIYNGPESLEDQSFNALAGPIYQIGCTIQRWVCVKAGQNCYAFEKQWLTAQWQAQIGAWTVDHPNC